MCIFGLCRFAHPHVDQVGSSVYHWHQLCSLESQCKRPAQVFGAISLRSERSELGRVKFWSSRTTTALVCSFALLVMIVLVHPTVPATGAITNAPTGPTSWNSKVTCTPTVVTIEQILGNNTNSLGGAAENGSIFNPGSTSAYGPANTMSWLTASADTPLGWVSPGPSCTITNAQGQVVSAFVQINGVQRSYRSETNYNTMFMAINGGGSYSTTRESDTSFDILTPGYGPCASTNTTGCMHTISAGIDHDWKGAGYCGLNTACDNNTLVSQTAAYKSLIDVQGFLVWNPSGVNSSDHNFSGWELHPVTAWRISNTSSDYTLSASPNPLPVVVGKSASSTITINTFNLFTGNITLTATVSSPLFNSSGPPPSAALSPSSVFVQPGGVGSSILTVTTNPSSHGNFTVTVTGSNGTLSRAAHIGIYITDFGLVSNPTSLSTSVGSSAQATVTVLTINGFVGNVSLTANVTASSPTASLSPNQPSTTFNNSSVHLAPGVNGSVTLTVSASLLTLPGSYTVTLTANGSGITRTLAIPVNVTVAGLQI